MENSVRTDRCGPGRRTYHRETPSILWCGAAKLVASATRVLGVVAPGGRTRRLYLSQFCMDPTRTYRGRSENGKDSCGAVSLRSATAGHRVRAQLSGTLHE